MGSYGTEPDPDNPAPYRALVHDTDPDHYPTKLKCRGCGHVFTPKEAKQWAGKNRTSSTR